MLDIDIPRLPDFAEQKLEVVMIMGNVIWIVTWKISIIFFLHEIKYFSIAAQGDLKWWHPGNDYVGGIFCGSTCEMPRSIDTLFA